MKTQHFIAYLMILIAMSLPACSSSSKTETAASETSADTENQGDYLISPAQFEMAQMSFDSLQPRVFHESVRANGTFVLPPQSKASVSAYYGGYVKEVNILAGQKVKKGQALFRLENPDYIQLQQDFLEAKGQLSYLKSDFERQKALLSQQASSEKSFLKAEADYNMMRVRYESLKKKLSLMHINPDGLDESNIRSSITISAPISGSITAVPISLGMYLHPEDIAVSLMNTDELFVEIFIYEQDLPKIAIDQPIRFHIQGHANKGYQARIFLINPEIDPQKRTISVWARMEKEANSPTFRPGMYIEAEIFTSTETIQSLPAEAVVASGDKHYVLVKTAQNKEAVRLEKREVSIGITDGDYVEILNSREFNGSSSFLVRGAFNLIQ